MNRAAFAVLIGMLLAPCAPAQDVKLPRAKEPLTLCDFANTEAVARWTGLTCEAVIGGQPRIGFVRGQPGMRFTFPKWEKGMNEWPAVYLRYDDGKGYPAKDWSHYGKIAFDAWTDLSSICRNRATYSTNPAVTGPPFLFAATYAIFSRFLMSRPDSFGSFLTMRSISPSGKSTLFWSANIRHSLACSSTVGFLYRNRAVSRDTMASSIIVPRFVVMNKTPR